MAITLAAGAAPATASSDLAIRSINVKPGSPVVGPSGSVKVVIEVVARGATSVAVVLEPGRTGPVNSGGPRVPAAPEITPPLAPPRPPAQPPVRPPVRPSAQAPAPLPAPVPLPIPMQGPAPAQNPAQNPVQGPAQNPAQGPAQNPAQGPAQNPVKSPAQNPVKSPAQNPVKSPAQNPAQQPAQLPAAQAPAQAHVPHPAPASTPGHAPAQTPAQAPAPATAPGAPWGTPAPRPAGAAAPPWTRPAVRGLPMSTTSANRSRSEWETWMFLPEKPLSRWYPSGQWTVTATARDATGAVAVSRTMFFLKRETTLEGVNVVRQAGGVRVTGTLLRVDPLGRVDYRPFPGQPVVLRFRPAGSQIWRTMRTTVTDRNGWFAGRLNGQGDGLWRAEYAGTRHYAGDISADRNP
ncbi:hypothetical protein Pth03_01080 [Planotetraspora thailandica]|uniref:Uncharacterized protein n=1 Tax=Planotetraspora thailandica TaxID=487172 RepID=A0A8J3V0A8_9ACTN|nr:hypothetical protein [Planotetraspora thailandica]GII51719.1 hypothetical protein Pth03_01080 [Planotetraspora thailandica]